MKIAIALDTFKGCVDGYEASYTLAQALASDGHQTLALPMADGGEGTARALSRLDMYEGVTGGEWRYVDTYSPLLTPMQAEWYHTVDNAAILDMATCCGLPLVPMSMRNPLKVSTYGLGLMLARIAASGVSQITVGLGGSASCDGAVGALQALGAIFYDKDGHMLTTEMNGEQLGCIASIDTARITTLPALIFLSDVKSPLCGPDGAARRFAPQKGATIAEVEMLEYNIKQWEDVLLHQGFKIPKYGAGAAGGFGCMAAIYDVPILSGADIIARKVIRLIPDYDLLITGEGRSDRSTLLGKAPYSLMLHAADAGIRTALLCGSLAIETTELLNAGYSSVRCINPPGATLSESMRPEVCLRRLTATARELVQSLS